MSPLSAASHLSRTPVSREMVAEHGPGSCLPCRQNTWWGGRRVAGEQGGPAQQEHSFLLLILSRRH